MVFIKKIINYDTLYGTRIAGAKLPIFAIILFYE